MFRTTRPTKNKIKVNTSYVGEMLETKIFKMVNNKEAIKDTVPLIYTERKDGIQPAYDIRTDRWEQALEAQDSITKGRLSKRAERLGQQAKKGMKKEDENSSPDKAGEIKD